MKVICPHCVHSLRDHDETGRCCVCKYCDPHPLTRAKSGDHTYARCECEGLNV